MSGVIGLKFQWGKAKKEGFVSYPYWSIYLDSGQCFKNKGYGTARATLSREAWKRFIIQYITYEKLLDKIMGRNFEFDKWRVDIINALNSVNLSVFNNELITAVNEEMKKNQKFGEDYRISIFNPINDNGNKCNP